MLDEKYKLELTNHFGSYYYQLGELYPAEFVQYLYQTKIDGVSVFVFRIDDRYSYMYYTVQIRKNNDYKMQSVCDCRKFRREKKCEHIVSVLLKYPKYFFPPEREDVYTISKKILQYYDPKQKTSDAEEVQLAYNLKIHERYQKRYIELSPKIGISRMYSLNETKMKKLLLEFYYKEENIPFGKDFTYDPQKHYFSAENEQFLEYLFHRYDHGNKRYILIFDEEEFLVLFDKLRNIPFDMDGFGLFHGIEEKCPFEFLLTKDDDENFILNVAHARDYSKVTNDGRLVIVDNKIYKLDVKYQKLLELLSENNLDQMIFSKEEFQLFNQGLLPLIQRELQVDSAVKNELIYVKPNAQLYFDLYDRNIVCNVKFMYGKDSIDAFDLENNTILRDFIYEKETLKDIKSYGFQHKNQLFSLEDIAKIGEFLENGIQKLNEKYQVFTSQKLKEMKLIKKNSITSTFSIGKDQILSYHFDFSNIDEDEIQNVFRLLKQKKKYYRLKNGNILDLEDQNLVDFSNFLDDMNIEVSADGVMKKYRALYLSSIQHNQSFTIETNDLFNQFIQQFLQYKDLQLTFTDNEKKLLRDYQLTGVKFLYQVHKCGLGAILADEMGLGKSLQVMIFLKRLLEEEPESKILIVVPTSLMYNWDFEFQKFQLNIPYQVVAGNKKNRKQILSIETNVWITSYGLVREDFDFYHKQNFKVCILDEAQNIKNPNAGITQCVKNIPAETKIALTGTPIENSVLELWSIFDFIMPGFLSSKEQFSQKYKVGEFNDETNLLLEKLNHLISPFILRRKKKDVMDDLPDKIENNIYIELSKTEKQLYMKAIQEANETLEKVLLEDGFQKSRFIILSLLTKLRQLCIDPRMLYDHFEEQSSKIENLIKVIREVTEMGHKVLLFTSFRTALDLVEKEFRKNQITSYRIDGSVPSKMRMELVEKFNHDDTNVFLIMLKSGGTGLNLTSADIVIHLDLWWNPQAESQATDRAHRIGQKHVVEVIKLITKGTIEEKILELQNKKKILSDKIIEGEMSDQNLLSTLSEKEIRYLLAYENEEN